MVGPHQYFAVCMRCLLSETEWLQVEESVEIKGNWPNDRSRAKNVSILDFSQGGVASCTVWPWKRMTKGDLRHMCD